MGGEIEVRSAPGGGSTFAVMLPLPRQASAAPAETVSPATVHKSFETGIRVLAAEDNPTNRLVLKALLSAVGIEPTLVEDGRQAVEAWTAGAWDLVLMDVQMPVMDGVEATLAIRAAERGADRPRTPIIALTANAMTYQTAGYLAAGMDGHVAKPIDAAALYAAIAAVLHPDQPALAASA